ncbi:MAG TPA: hypothetical protein VK390_16375 [Propionibacteriaceae bacterium]|nr:hypothetical protein [Propionibacteriaceae bacterium]
MKRRRLWFIAAAIIAGMLAAAPPAAAQPRDSAPGNAHNCAGHILSGSTPQDFHHGEGRARAVPQAEDGRGEEITAFTSAAASEDCSDI